MPELHDFAKRHTRRSSAVINIRNLRLRTLIGFNPDEMIKKQDIVLNIEICYTLSDTVLKDRVDDALNYKTITKRVIGLVEEGQFKLLEKLVSDVLAICSEHPSVQSASVTIDKPHALRFADSVALTLVHHSQTNNSNNLLEKVS